MSEHTPGPWKVVPLKGFRKFAIIGPDRHAWNGRRKSVAYTGASYPKNRIANARLIAAAPELLEAARKAVIDNKRVLPSKDEPAWIACLRAAILKATQEADHADL